jgi:hypothetical protein
MIRVLGLRPNNQAGPPLRNRKFVDSLLEEAVLERTRL